MQMKRILFIGDSLIEFFDWQARFPGHTVATLGRAGETVEGLLSRIKAITMKHPSPDLVFIMTGINNAAMEDLGFLDAYGKIMDHLSASCPGARIFVHSLLPTLLPWISNASLREVNRSLARMAEEKGGEFIDLYRRYVDGEGVAVKDYLLPDGVHLSDQGYAVWAETLEKITAL
jgi:lysophospholipase L1-like esterase